MPNPWPNHFAFDCAGSLLDDVNMQHTIPLADMSHITKTM